MISSRRVYSEIWHGIYDKIHAHFEDEITKLTQLDIPESEALELVSEQFILIYGSLF